MELDGDTTAGKSVWLKIWHFPLVAMVVAAALALVTMAVAGTIDAKLFQPNLSEPAEMILGTVLSVGLLMLVYKLAIRRLGGKQHDDLPFAAAPRDLAKGLAGGALLISTCVALAAIAGVYAITGRDDGSDVLTIVLATGVSAGFVEELLLRGIVFRWLEELLGSWIALALSALLFGFLHAWNDNATVFSSVAIAIEAGILLGAAYMLTRSLWFAMGIHAGWNVVQGLWDVPVSGYHFDSVIAAKMEGPRLLAGGGFGLEATIFALVIATAAGVWLLVLAARKGRIVAPVWSRKGAPITAY